MFGPHFYYDLIRLARKPRNLLLRIGYLLALLLAWWLVWENSANFNGHINEFAETAANYTRAMLVFQYALILLLTPMYLAGTVIEEKENRTLELLYQTQLTDSEILLGKFSARVVFLAMLSLSSMPLLAIVSLWGGVSLELLGLHFAFTLLLIILIGSMSLFASVQATRFVDAMLIAYALVFIIAYAGLGLAPAVLLHVADVSMASVYVAFGVTASLMLSVSAALYWVTLRQFRRLRNLAWMKEMPRLPPPRRANPRPRPRRKSKPSDAPTLPVPDNALLWKELMQSRLVAAIPVNLIWTGLAFAVFLALLHGLQPWLRLGHPDRMPIEVPIHFFFASGYFFLTGGIFLLHTFQSTSAVARERENNTLDFLLLLPQDRHEILFWKWLAPWIRNRVMIGSMIAMPLLGMLSGMYFLQTGFLLLVLPWPALLFINQLGLLLSVVCRRVVIANLWLIGILLALFLAHLLYWQGFVWMMQTYFELLIETEGMRRQDAHDTFWGIALVLGHQSFFLLGALVSTIAAFWLFARRNAETRTQVW